jgi:hypothetical protein
LLQAYSGVTARPQGSKITGPGNHPRSRSSLPKFHCELNFIEFFWGIVTKYLREQSDHTFDTLKENLPKALSSVPLATIRGWKHRMYRWMDAYRAGMGTQDAQLHVRNFGSR